MEPPPFPVEIGMRYKNAQSRDKRQLNKNSISFKMDNCNSLYNALKEIFISGSYYKLTLLSKDAQRTFIIGIVYFKALPCLFEVVMD